MQPHHQSDLGHPRRFAEALSLCYICLANFLAFSLPPPPPHSNFWVTIHSTHEFVGIVLEDAWKWAMAWLQW